MLALLPGFEATFLFPNGTQYHCRCPALFQSVDINGLIFGPAAHHQNFLTRWGFREKKSDLFPPFPPLWYFPLFIFPSIFSSLFSDLQIHDIIGIIFFRGPPKARNFLDPQKIPCLENCQKKVAMQRNVFLGGLILRIHKKTPRWNKSKPRKISRLRRPAEKKKTELSLFWVKEFLVPRKFSRLRRAAKRKHSDEPLELDAGKTGEKQRGGIKRKIFPFLFQSKIDL